MSDAWTRELEQMIVEVGGPYPGVSVITCVDGGSTHPEHAEPPLYEPVCIVDQRTEGEPHPISVATAERIVACWNACRNIPTDKLSALAPATEVSVIEECRQLWGRVGILEALLAEESSWNPNLGRLKHIKPGHGPCCTCQTCGHHHDDCVCRHNEIEKRLEQFPLPTTAALARLDAMANTK